MEMSSPSLPAQSDDELFNPTYRRPTNYETIDTLPVARIQDSPEPDTLVTLPAQPFSQNTQTQRGLPLNTTGHSQYFTQPTQIIDRSPHTDISSPVSKPTVQVAASSPMATIPALTARKPSGILASAMAPAGTTFRRPLPLPTVPSNRKPAPAVWNEIPSSDSDSDDLRRNDIKTTTFARKSAAEKIPDSPQAGSTTNRFGQFSYQPGAGLKRSSDAMANTYGNISKKPRQTEPSRALPATQLKKSTNHNVELDMELDDIGDFSMRTKVKRMKSCLLSQSIRTCYQALLMKRGNYDDAVDYLTQSDTKDDAPKQAIDLTGSDDELLMTPAATKAKAIQPVVNNDMKQQAKKPAQSIAQKWSSTQTATKKPTVPNRKLDVFEDPGPAPIKKRTLIRGRKDRSSPPPTQAAQKLSQERKHITIDDDSDGDAASGVNSQAEDESFETRLLHFFNNCTALDFCDTAGITREIAEHFVSQRPYRSLAAISKVEAPSAKPTKSKRKANLLGERILDKVDEMMRSYEAVDFLVKKCEGIAKPLANDMKAWGVDIYGKSGSAGELDLTSLRSPESQGSGGSHDSGIGTPISDDDRDIKAGTALTRRGFIGQPASLAEDVVMKDYQIVGINWLSLLFRKGLSCILADDMGLGKTLQTIAFIAHLAEIGEKGPHLIVVPAATLENWLKEFHRFCPGLNVEPYYSGIPGERVELRAQIDDMRDEINVVITTYTLAKGKEDFPWLKNFGFCSTIYDEGHVLKNAASQVSQKLTRIQSRFRLLLTGTPLQNNLQELISLLAFLMPKLFAEKTEELEAIFKQSVNTISDNQSNREMLLSKRRIDRARSMLTPFILRRKKWQVLKDLPAKFRKVQYCDMTPEQTEVYNGWLASAWEIRERKSRGEKVGAEENSNILMKLRQAAIHPLLFQRVYKHKTLLKIAKACLKVPTWALSNPDLILRELSAYSDFEIHDLCSKHEQLRNFTLADGEWDLSGKVQAMMKLLNSFQKDGHRTLIFSQFVMVLDILELVLNQHGIKFFRLDGNTKVSERQDLIDEFCDPECEVQVFMLSTKAGGAGINLAKANRVIVFDSGFNPQDDVQAENRAHRIGQTKEVEVWRLVTKGTVEEQIYNMGVVKLKLDREVAGESVDDLESGGAKLDEEIEREGKKTVEEMFFSKLDENKKKQEEEERNKSSISEKRVPPLSSKIEPDSGSDSDSSLSDVESVSTPNDTGFSIDEPEPEVTTRAKSRSKTTKETGKTKENIDGLVDRRKRPQTNWSASGRSARSRA